MNSFDGHYDHILANAGTDAIDDSHYSIRHFLRSFYSKRLMTMPVDSTVPVEFKNESDNKFVEVNVKWDIPLQDDRSRSHAIDLFGNIFQFSQ